METVDSSQQQKKTTGGARTYGAKKQGDPEHPLVSIITIVLNGESFIRQTIDSVLQQRYGLIEYIVIDGGSHDSTVSILREYDSKIDFWQSEPDKGISDAFNKGINAAQGEFIGLINAGDWYEADTVQRVVETFLADREVGVVCGALQFWKGLQREYICHSVPQLLGREMTVTHPTCFVHAELYHSFGLFSPDYKFAMDYELLLRFKQQGARFLALDSVLANMQHDGVSEENWKMALQETHRARTELLESSFCTSHWYYCFLLIKRELRIFLEKLGWTSLLHFYRSRLALVKKTKL
ncbi:MAG: glycosyltransferase [Proteobacteria bacterium]|nr:glycosyltransferase [Pseudomonadota bacterium]MBU1420413.1 glycosyltransferase [Pseudomonadota bacterium]MBU1456384.1 glycosyltransferase [Pseudomonadota bacterium]